MRSEQPIGNQTTQPAAQYDAERVSAAAAHAIISGQQWDEFNAAALAADKRCKPGFVLEIIPTYKGVGMILKIPHP